MLRRSVRDSMGKVYTSPELASHFNQMSARDRRLGRSFGIVENFKSHMLRHAGLAGSAQLREGQEGAAHRERSKQH